MSSEKVTFVMTENTQNCPCSNWPNAFESTLPIHTSLIKIGHAHEELQYQEEDPLQQFPIKLPSSFGGSSLQGIYPQFVGKFSTKCFVKSNFIVAWKFHNSVGKIPNLSREIPCKLRL